MLLLQIDLVVVLWKLVFLALGRPLLNRLLERGCLTEVVRVELHLFLLPLRLAFDVLNGSAA